MVVPGALSFCKYHLLHHRHMGDLELDAGVPGPLESRIIGRSSVMKALWIAGFILIMGIVRPHRMKRVRLLDPWTATNIAIHIAAMAALIAATGRGPVAY